LERLELESDILPPTPKPGANATLFLLFMKGVPGSKLVGNVTCALSKVQCCHS